MNKKAGKKNVKRKAAIKRSPELTINNSTLTGLQIDGKAVETIEVIAEGLLQNALALAENARGLQELAKTFSGSSFTMFHLGDR